jgi:hypothetical protein
LKNLCDENHIFQSILTSIVLFLSALLLNSTALQAQTPHREEITVIAPYEPTFPMFSKSTFSQN